MNIKDLKIGDTIQYQLPHSGFSFYDACEGKIIKIYSDSVIVKNNIHVSEKYIIKKIEKEKPIWPDGEFIEESKGGTKNSIKISELKIGDRVKFGNFIWDYSDNTGIIKYFIDKNRVRLIHHSGEIEMDTDLIVSKLDPIPKYKEIPIDKSILEKEEYIFAVCSKCGNSSYPYKVTKTDICNYCKDKEKSVPKSFKFDIKITECSVNYERYGLKPKTILGGYGVSPDTNNYIEFTGLPIDDIFDIKKSYTIEIKEKE